MRIAGIFHKPIDLVYLKLEDTGERFNLLLVDSNGAAISGGLILSIVFNKEIQLWELKRHNIATDLNINLNT